MDRKKLCWTCTDLLITSALINKQKLTWRSCCCAWMNSLHCCTSRLILSISSSWVSLVITSLLDSIWFCTCEALQTNTTVDNLHFLPGIPYVCKCYREKLHILTGSNFLNNLTLSCLSNKMFHRSKSFIYTTNFLWHWLMSQEVQLLLQDFRVCDSAACTLAV